MLFLDIFHQGSNMYNFITPFLHVCTALGANIRRTRHHSKVINVSHLQNQLFITPYRSKSLWHICLDCADCQCLENGQRWKPNRRMQRTHATSPRMIMAPIGYPPHTAGTSPFRGTSWLLCLQWTSRLDQVMFTAINHITEDQDGSTRDVASSANQRRPRMNGPH